MMSETDTDDDSRVDEESVLYKHDFVRVSFKHHDVTVSGRVVEVIDSTTVRIQIYEPDGPTTDTVKIDARHVSLHPAGRLAILNDTDTEDT